jgi:carboxypeptidase T
MKTAAIKAVVAGGLSLILSGVSLGHSVDLNQTPVVTITSVALSKDKSELKNLIAEGYDIAGIDFEKSTVDVMTATKDEGVALGFYGFKVKSQKTIDTMLAPDSSYKTPEEIQSFVRNIANAYPGLVRVESIGKSHENRDIWAVKITDNPEVRERDEPTIFFNAMHHAREVMGPEVAIDTIEFLLANYGSDADVTRWLNENEVWIVPMLNPDGNNKVWTSNSMWRKNTREGYGVDINRNYPYAWNTCNGSSGSTSNDTYRGPSAGSEPEAQALMNLVARIQPVFSISYHSYSELVIYPYGCEGQRTETKSVVESIGKDLASLVQKDSGSGGYAPGTSWELLYSVDGGDIDWMYNVHHVIPYVIEVNASAQGFQPAYRWRSPTVEKMRPGWKMLFNRLAGSGVRGIVRDSSGRTLPQANIKVETLGSGVVEPINWKIKDDGTFHVVLNPGTYKLKFDLAGKTVERDVTVGAERIDLDIEM